MSEYITLKHWYVKLMLIVNMFKHNVKYFKKLRFCVIIIQH